jgi:hypothetical protein
MCDHFLCGHLQLSSLRSKRISLSRNVDHCQISAAAAPLAPSVSPLEDAEERKRLAEEYGFTQIGEPVPEEVTLKNVIDTFPPEVSDDNISELLCKDF